MPHHPEGADAGTSYWFRLLVTPFKVIDWYRRLLSEVRCTWMVRWFQALFTGLQGMPVDTQLFFVLFQISHSCPPAMRHWLPHMKLCPLRYWLMSSSNTWEAGRLLE